jgi:hypothetical protein
MMLQSLDERVQASAGLQFTLQAIITKALEFHHTAEEGYRSSRPDVLGPTRYLDRQVSLYWDRCGSERNHASLPAVTCAIRVIAPFRHVYLSALGRGRPGECHHLNLC